MAELDKIKRAQFIIEELANGIDPTNGKIIPEGDTVNNVKISRCFFYVSGILKELIDKEENASVITNNIKDTVPNHTVPKPILPFSLTKDQLLNLKTSPKPLSSSEIAQYLNSLIDQQTMDKITPNAINSWLMHLGLLENVPYEDGRKRKVPTEQGEALGIVLEKRFGRYGKFFVSAFNEEAQQFIYDNLDAIISLKYRGV